MNGQGHDSTFAVMSHVDVEAGELISSLARERLAAQLTSSVNLSQRVTQVCALQVAAATFVATLAAVGHSRMFLWSSTGSAMLFLAGALVALRGMWSERASSPGLAPRFFAAAATGEPLTGHGAITWSTTAMSEMIERNERDEARRATYLNHSLSLAAAAAVTVALATIARAIWG